MLAKLLGWINEQHGANFVAGRRYPTGEQGAFAISTVEGEAVRRFVLKWEQGTELPDGLWRAAEITARLREVGYPAPRYRLVGVAPGLGAVYSVQEELPGAPMGGQLDRALLDRLLELNALQEGRGTTRSGDWPKPIADTVLYGGDGFCLLDPLRSYSSATAALLGELQRLAAAGGEERTRQDDVVHFDFQGANILAANGEVSGVVDWEGCLAGDRSFDLVTLYFYAAAGGAAEAEQVERLWRFVGARIGPRLLGVYLAHLVLRQVDWSIRFHDRAAVERWMGWADEVLHRLLA
jgi:hypothetical protein